MGPTTKPSSELPYSLFSPQPACRGSACPPPTPTGSLTEERLLIPGVLPTAQHSAANKRCSKTFVGGREAGRGKGAHSRAAWKVSIPPGAGSHARSRTGGRAAKDKSLCGRLRGQQLEGSHALQNVGLPLGGGQANALCRGQCHRPEPVLSLPSSSEPSLVPSSTPQLLMVCENLRKADTVPALKQETTQQGGLKE